MKKTKFAFIGCGRISKFHADVVKHLGHEISTAVSKEGSKHIGPFAKDYKVGQQIEGIKAFLKHFQDLEDSIDCILVCTPWDVTEKIIVDILDLGKPVMAEKPVVLSMKSFDRLNKSKHIRNLFPAYNRRFYDFIPFLKKMVSAKKPIAVDILSAEPLEMIVRSQGEKIKSFMPYFYTTHIIDLLFYLFADIRIENVYRHLKNGEKSFVCNLITTSNVPVQMKILMDCPQNSYFRLYFEDKVAQLCPLERLSIYKGMAKNFENKGVKYTPLLKKTVETNYDFKPGFLNQTNYFLKNFVFKKNIYTREIEELKKVTAFCEKLTRQ